MGKFFRHIPTKPLPPVNDSSCNKKDVSNDLLLDANVAFKKSCKRMNDIYDKVKENTELWKMIRDKIDHNIKNGRTNTVLGFLEIDVLLTDVSDESLNCAYFSIITILRSYNYRAMISEEPDCNITIEW